MNDEETYPSEAEVRLTALTLALEFRSGNPLVTHTDTVAHAEEFRKFLMGEVTAKAN